MTYHKLGSILILSLLILATLIISISYTRRGIQGRLRSAADDIGDQYTSASLKSRSGTAQYEPYYLDSQYTVEKNTRTSSPSPTANIPNIPRKLIRRGEMNLKVQDSVVTLQKITTLAQAVNAVIIDSQINKNANEQKTGSATFKVLPGDFDAILGKLRSLGKVEHEKISGEDVTEQYVDVQARLHNAQRVRDRLLKILEERAREVKDILEVERELARVGADIESMEGRLKYLDRQVDLSTISVYFYESNLSLMGSLNLGDEFHRTLRQSLEVFVHTFNGAIVVLAALLPIGFWIFVVSLPIWGICRMRRKK